MFEGFFGSIFYYIRVQFLRLLNKWVLRREWKEVKLAAWRIGSGREFQE